MHHLSLDLFKFDRINGFPCSSLRAAFRPPVNDGPHPSRAHSAFDTRLKNETETKEEMRILGLAALL
jgi:hypothetical protein